jgi:hypothetical protein
MQKTAYLTDKLQITGMIAENCLLAWNASQMTGVTTENSYLPDKDYK